MLFDAVFSKLCLPKHAVNENKIIELSEYVTVSLVKWRDLQISMGPKMHAIEDHAVKQVQEFEGIGELTEDYIEQAHQTGMKDERRTLGMRDQRKAAGCHIKWEEMKNAPTDQAAAEVVRRNSK